MLALALPASLQLGLAALCVSVVLGVLLGVLAAVRQGTLTDHAVTVVSTVGAAVPSFVVALLLIVLFSLRWPILPVAGHGTWAHLVLPVVALSAEPIAVYARYSRSAMLDTLVELYVTVARGKGLPERTIVLRHALRNALPPIVTVVGLVLPRLFVGSFLVETIFAIPGTGRFLVIAVNQRDYPVVMAMAIVYAAAVAIVNLIVDLSYAYLNPRLRYG
jgi:dipeptide transport system permease protein